MMLSCWTDDEAEQALVAAEDARAEAAALAVEVERLSRELQSRGNELRQAHEALDAFRAERDRDAAQHCAQRQQATEDAGVLAEELRVANEELAVANEELALANAQLEQRVAERTAALAEQVAAKDAALREKELLAAEVDHRIANSLQLVRSILNLHATTAREVETARQFQQAAARVQTIAAVHRLLYRREDHAVAGDQPVSAYLDGLVESLWSSVAAEGSPRISPTVEPGLALRADRMLAVGLVVTELVTNALKHGGSKVWVSVYRDTPDAVEVAVADDGPGFPPDFQPTASPGLGMRVVSAYATKPGGVRIDHLAPGGYVVVTIPA